MNRRWIRIRSGELLHEGGMIMVRSVGVGALGIVMFAASPGRAQDSGPPLTSPTLRPPADADARVEAAEPRRPLLVIPGVTAPARTARKPSTPAVAKPALSGPEPVTTPAPKVTIPLTLEPIPAGEEDAASPIKPRSPQTDAPPAGTPRSFPGSVLGRILGTNEPEGFEGDGITVESRTDPAVEAAVKRRIEKEVREALGDRADSIEVRVKGRNVLIRAHASRFWRRWSVRRTLDGLSMPSGYRGRAELID